MTGFKLGSSGIGSNRALNCATNSAQLTQQLTTRATFDLKSLLNHSKQMLFERQHQVTLHLISRTVSIAIAPPI